MAPVQFPFKAIRTANDEADSQIRNEAAAVASLFRAVGACSSRPRFLPPVPGNHEERDAEDGGNEPKAMRVGKELFDGFHGGMD